jgi:segregation and condensation protein A
LEKLLNIIHQSNWKIILYDLVRTNELDLWNVDLIKLSNLYLENIKKMEERNLIVPANAVLAATILLKLKTYSLKLTTIEDEEDDFKLLDKNELELNSAIDLNTPMRLKEGQVSLDELIDVIDTIMNKPTKKNIERKIKEKEEFNFILPKKTKDISKRIDEFYNNIKENVDSENLILFSYFKKNLSNSGQVIQECFIPMLFLAMDNKINVWQDDFFSEIFIKLV